MLGPHRVGRSAIFSFVATAVPGLAAVVAVPLLVSELGVERFGVLGLSWALIGAAGIFELGLGRALTQEVAAAIGRGSHDAIPELTRGYLRLLAAAGTGGGLVVAASAPWLAGDALGLPQSLESRASFALLIVAALVPVVVIASGLRGLLEALDRFGLLAAVRGPVNVATVLGPVALLPVTHELVALVGAVAAARLLGALVLLRAAGRLVAGLARRPGAFAVPLRRHWRLARWMAVTNTVGPVMVSFDRVVIGALLGAAAVAYYAAPSDVVLGLALLPLSIVGVLFPAFARQHAANPTAAFATFGRWLGVLVAWLVPPALVLFAYAPEILQAWLDPRFADRSAGVVRWLAVGVVLNGAAQVPFVLIQAAGRPDLTGRLHLSELVPYLVVLLVGIDVWGIQGAAGAWALRAGADAAVLFWLAHRAVGLPVRRVMRAAIAIAAAFAPAAGALVVDATAAPMGAAVSLGLLSFAVALRAPVPRL